MIDGSENSSERGRTRAASASEKGLIRRPLRKYAIILWWSDEDGAFVAYAPDLPGCMAHGDDEESALRNINDAMVFWIDTAKELGEPIPEPKSSVPMLARELLQ